MRVLPLLLLLFSFPLQSQNYHNIWFFGQNAGINFNHPNAQEYSGGHINSMEGCSVICDEKGAIMFYSNGKQIWNKQFIPMKNGEHLRGHHSSTQSSLIVPHPAFEDQYYLITTDALAGTNGLRYSLIDMDADVGRGQIVRKNVLLLSKSTEKLTAVYHENGKDIWVLAHGWNNNKFYAFLITESGFQSPIISEIGLAHTPHKSVIFTNTGQAEYEFNRSAIGYMKVSPNGRKIALAVSAGDRFVETFTFNPNTGIVSQPITIKDLGSGRTHPLGEIDICGPYGIEFSPDSRFLYVGQRSFEESDHPVNILQFDLSDYHQESIIASKEIIAVERQLGALQLGPDNRIYVAKRGSKYLSIIQSPNKKGSAASYQNYGIYLPNGTSRLGLPNNFHIRNKKIHKDQFTSVIYPNPVIGTEITLTVSEAHQHLEIVIHHLSGLEVYRQQTHLLENHIDLPKLSSGAYAYTILFEGKPIDHGRFVVQH